MPIDLPFTVSAIGRRRVRISPFQLLRAGSVFEHPGGDFEIDDNTTGFLRVDLSTKAIDLEETYSGATDKIYLHKVQTHAGEVIELVRPENIPFLPEIVGAGGSFDAGTLYPGEVNDLSDVYATKVYADAVAQGLDIRDSVRVATTANITLSGDQTIDDIDLNHGDRVLVKNQSTASQNGIYEVNTGGAWSRSDDADSDDKVDPGMFTFVEEGTVNADSGWVLSTNEPITLGTTALTFTQFSSAGAVNAGSGLVKTGSTMAVRPGNSFDFLVDASLSLKDIKNAMDYGPLGDGTGDDSTELQAALDASAGKILIFPTGKTFRLTTKLIAENVTAIAYGATFNLVVSADTTGHCIRNYTRIFGGAWNTQYSAGSPINGASMTVFNIGSYAGENEAGGTGHHDIIIQDVTITNTRNDSNGIWISGNSYNVLIKNLTVPASATLARPIAVHWGGWKAPGTYIVGDTKHPHSIIVENYYCGALTYTTNPTEVTPLFFSGCYNIKVRNVVCEECTTGILLYAGDVGFRWASVTENALAYSGIVFESVVVKKCRKYGSLTFGVSTDTSAVVWRIPARFKDCAWRGPADGTITGSTDFAGISPRGVDGLVYENCNVSGFEYGAFATEHPGHEAGNYRVHDIEIIGGQYHDNYQNGIYIHSTGISLIAWRVQRVRAYLNGVGGGSNFTTAGIRIGTQTGSEVSGSLFGDPVSEPRQGYGVRVDVGSVALKITGNHCISASLGVAFSFGNSVDDGQTMCSEVSGNTKGSLGGANTLYGGALNLPVHGGYKELLAGNANSSIDMTPNGPSCTVYDTPITQDRAVVFTFFTSPGSKGRITRIIRTANATDSGGGPFFVNVGTGPLVALAIKQWCDIEADGAAVRLVGYGTLP